MATVYEEIMVELVKPPEPVVYDPLSVIDDLPDNVIQFPRNPDEI
tara:strand:+ start:314 stop:448 length:135 start_codon:yes stop_codon:yes gene_type:complete